MYAIVGLVNELTKDRIIAQSQLQLLNTLHSIIEPHRYNNNITQDCVNLNTTILNTNNDNKTTQTAYIARKDNTPIAVAITNTAPDGYNGNIDFIVAINMDNTISGVRVLKHQETPGLGDKVEIRKSAWITGFNGKKNFFLKMTVVGLCLKTAAFSTNLQGQLLPQEQLLKP